MAYRKPKEKIDIDVVPYLSIMAIVLKLICLILVIILMRIAINPEKRRIVSLGLFTSRRTQARPKMPSYVDCGPNGLTLYPGNASVSWEQLQHSGNPMEKLLDKVEANTSNEYVIVMVRPQSVKFYRLVRNMIKNRVMDVGYDAVDTDFKVNWNEALKALSVVED